MLEYSSGLLAFSVTVTCLVCSSKFHNPAEAILARETGLSRSDSGVGAVVSCPFAQSQLGAAGNIDASYFQSKMPLGYIAMLRCLGALGNRLDNDISSTHVMEGSGK